MYRASGYLERDRYTSHANKQRKHVRRYKCDPNPSSHNYILFRAGKIVTGK